MSLTRPRTMNVSRTSRRLPQQPHLDATADSVQSYVTCSSLDDDSIPSEKAGRDDIEMVTISADVSSEYESPQDLAVPGRDLHLWKYSPGNIVAFGTAYTRTYTMPSTGASASSRHRLTSDRTTSKLAGSLCRLNQRHSSAKLIRSPSLKLPNESIGQDSSGQDSSGQSGLVLNSTTNNSDLPFLRCHFDNTEDLSMITGDNSVFLNASHKSKDIEIKRILSADQCSDYVHNVPYVVVTGNTVSMEYTDDDIATDNRLTYISNKRNSLSPQVLYKSNKPRVDNNEGHLVPTRLLTTSPLQEDDSHFREYSKDLVVLPRGLRNNLTKLHNQSKLHADRYSTRLRPMPVNAVTADADGYDTDEEGVLAPPSTPAVNQNSGTSKNLTPNCRIIFTTGSSYQNHSPTPSIYSEKGEIVKASEVTKRLEEKLHKERENTRKEDTNNNIVQRPSNNVSGRNRIFNRKILTYIGPLDTTFCRRIMRYSPKNRLGAAHLPRPDPIVIMRATLGPIVAAQLQAEQNNQIRGLPRHFAIAIVIFTYLFLGMAAVLPGQVILDIHYFMTYDMNKALLLVAGRDIGIIFGALMVGGAFRGHRWFLGYSTAAMLAAICFLSCNFVKNYKALTALFVGIGVSTAFMETATNVITLRMAHRRRLTLNYSQLAYALGSVILVFLADLYVRPNEQIFYYKGTFIGYKMMFYYACIVFSFIALLSLMFWFFVERYEIDNSAINYLKKRQYNPWTKLETLTSLFYFAQVGHQRIYEWVLYSYVIYSRGSNTSDVTLLVALYHVMRAAYFLLEVLATALQIRRTSILLPFSLIGCFASSLCMFLYQQNSPDVIYICICLQGFCTAAMGPATMVWFSKWHNSALAGTRARFWGGSFGGVILPFITVLLMKNEGLACRYFQIISLACVLIQTVVCLLLFMNGLKLSRYARRRAAARAAPIETEYWEIFTCFR